MVQDHSSKSKAAGIASPVARLRNKRTAFVAKALAFFAVSVLGTFLGVKTVSRPTRESATPLTIGNQYLDFGTVWARPDYKWEIVVANASKQPVELLDLRASCGCTTVEPKQVTIKPESEARLTMTLDLLNGKGGFTDSWQRDFSVDVVPIIRGRRPAPGDEWRLSGRVKKLFGQMPLTADFGESIVVGSPFAGKQITLSANCDIGTLNVADGGTSFIVAVEKVDAHRFTITVLPQPDLPMGRFDRTTQVVASGGDLSAPEIVNLNFRGEVVEDIHAVPPFLVLGVVPIGQDLPLEIMIRSRSGRKIERVDAVMEDSPTDSDLQDVTTATLSAGGDVIQKVTAHCPAKQLGMQRVHCVLDVRAANGHVQRVTVPVTYFGLTPNDSNQADTNTKAADPTP